VRELLSLLDRNGDARRKISVPRRRDKEREHREKIFHFFRFFYFLYLLIQKSV
jgi:hypothetical protein